MAKRSIFCLCALLAVSAPALAVAAPADAPPPLVQGDKPVEITADSLEVLQADRTASFRGKVKAVQGEVVLTADAMKVFYRENKESGQPMGAVSKIEAEGNVFLATSEETARGARGLYDMDARKVFLLGDVVLTRGENVLKGARLEYNFATGRSVIGGAETQAGDGAKPGRVSARFVPEKKKNGK